jgi:hypothetical protein
VSLYPASPIPYPAFSKSASFCVPVQRQLSPDQSCNYVSSYSETHGAIILQALPGFLHRFPKFPRFQEATHHKFPAFLIEEEVCFVAGVTATPLFAQCIQKSLSQLNYSFHLDILHYLLSISTLLFFANHVLPVVNAEFFAALVHSYRDDYPLPT